jgi:hypothetical protein
LLDENNEAEISDEFDLMPALNRAFDDALDILSRKYPDALIQPLTVPIVPGQALYDIPEDAYQERLAKVEAFVNGFYTEIKRIAYNDITAYDVPSSGTPYYYAVMGNQYKLAPPPRNINGIRIWYIPEKGPMVPEYGRISSINTGDNYVVVTDIADPTQVSNGIDSLASFVNIVDNRSGMIKATMQIQSVGTSKLTFKTTPSRTTVQGRTVLSALPATVERDDYICPVDGTCIPPMRSPLTNFLISYTVADIKAIKLDGDPQVVMKMLEKFEQRVERTWVRREQELRVGKASRIWGPRARNFWSRTPSS